MASVNQIHLQPGEHPPEACGWVLIEQTPHGRYDIVSCTREADHRRYDYDPGLFSLASALEHALPALRRLGVAKLYVQLDDSGAPGPQ